MQKISREQATEIIGFIILYTNYYSMPEWEEVIPSRLYFYLTRYRRSMLCPRLKCYRSV